MPGFSGDNSGAGTGQSRGVYVEDVGSSGTLLFTATKRTRVTSLIATNKEGGILPISLYVIDASEDQAYVLRNIRVFKSMPLVMELVDGDERTMTNLLDQVPLVELVLMPGDELYATTPINDSFDITLAVREGVR
jgi:hypothetical protein